MTTTTTTTIFLGCDSIEINLVYHRRQSVVQINDQENVYQAQGLNFERAQKHHTLQIESDDEDFPPPYFLGSNSTYTTRHRDSFSH